METARAQSEIVGTAHGQRTGAVQFPLKVRIPYKFDFRTISLRSPYGSDPERRRKTEQKQ